MKPALALALLPLAALLAGAPLRLPVHPPGGDMGRAGALRSTAALDADWDAVLAEGVRGGVPDWDVLRARELPRLDRYLEGLARVDAAALTPAGRTAYWLNLYEATCLRAACGQARTWSPAARNFEFFRLPLVRTLAGTLSLDSLSRGVIRPNAHDPRVHVALWCGARSSPGLPARAWRGADLDPSLARAMTAFLRDPARNRLDGPRHVLVLSRVFDWYAADFGGPGAVPAYVAHFTREPCEGWRVEFADWSWELAGVPGR